MQITDASLKRLEEFKNLKYVNLRRTKMTNPGLQELRGSLPNCLVYPMSAAIATDKLDEAQAIRETERLGGKVERDDQLPGRPVTGVSFRVGSDFGDEDVPLLNRFTRLTKLDLSGTMICRPTSRAAA